MKTSEKHQLGLSLLQQQRVCLDAKIAKKINEMRELSTAEKWLREESGYKYLSINQKSCVDPWATAAHEAGQKHGALVERDKYGPLVGAARKLLSDYAKMLLRNNELNVTDIRNSFAEALKNLESNTEPTSAEPKSEIGTVVSTDTNVQARMADITIQTSISTPLRIMDRVKLTPIKD